MLGHHFYPYLNGFYIGLHCLWPPYEPFTYYDLLLQGHMATVFLVGIFVLIDSCYVAHQ